MSDPNWSTHHHWLFDLGIASSSAIESRLRDGNTDSQEFYYYVDRLVEAQNRLSHYIADVQERYMRMTQQQSTKEEAK